MSGADYAHCDHCGTKAFYDADTEVGDAAIFHGKCLPEHDAAVAAKAWREGFTTGQSRAMRHMSDEPLLPLSAPNPYEREGGASDADT